MNFCKECGIKVSYNNKSGLCKGCKPPPKSGSEKVSDFRRKRKRDLVEYKGGKCQKCGYNKSIWALDFHHLDPSIKSYKLSSNSCHPLESDKKEADKCILVCKNCHAEIHEQIYNDSVAQWQSVSLLS